MGILDKFDNVEIKADDRIDSADKVYCEQRQTAYEKGRAVLKEMRDIAERAHAEQETLLGRSHSEYYGSRYLPRAFLPSAYQSVLDGSHKELITDLVSYFSNKYKVDIDVNEIANHLIPAKPTDPYGSYCSKPEPEVVEAYKKKLNEYNDKLESLSLKYSDILDQIFIQFGGQGFVDCGVSRLKEKCHKAAWSSYKGTAEFEQKKSTITFGNMTSYDDWYAKWYPSEPTRFKPYDSMKDIIRGLSHFEIGVIDRVCGAFNSVLDYEVMGAQHDIGLERVSSIKFFKNGRVDVRFTTEAYAREFVEQYLGTAA